MFAAFCKDISSVVSIAAGRFILDAGSGQTEVLNGTDLYPPLSVILVIILVIAGVFAYNVHGSAPQWLEDLRKRFIGSGGNVVTGDETLDKAIETAGYSYDAKQDVFYSNIDAWQRNMGYCRLYDEAAAPLGMIIDCEPIYFTYDGKRWLIELWKGQYDLTCGCEVGVYITEGPDIEIPGVYKGPFFNSASNADLLEMSYTLKKKGEKLFTRDDKHWWLTGFKLGEFSEPWELTMDLDITLKDEWMLNAFVGGLKKAGYSEDEIIIKGNTVSIKFDETRTPQPITRTPETDQIIQRKNQLLCEKYQEITGPYDNFPDKIKAIKEQAPELFEDIMNVGKNKRLFSLFEDIKNYLN